MKLKKIIPERTHRISDPSVRIGKAGAFQFSLTAMKELEMKKFESLEFYQDEEDPLNWYFQLIKKGDITLRFCKKDSKGPIFNCNDIATKIKKSTWNATGESVKAIIGKPLQEDGKTFYPLLIKKGDCRDQ